jgi:hypothetical protein
VTQVAVQTYANLRSYRATVTLLLMALCLALVGIYAVNVVTLISHTVALQKTETAVSALTLSTNDLDGKYLEAMSGITPELASRYGLRPAEVSEYISNSASLGRVALGGHEF